MSQATATECCPQFHPEPWDDKTLVWEDKPFVKDHVTSCLHVPLNFRSVMNRNTVKIDAADAHPEEMVVLADENSLWGSDIFIEVTKDVPGAEMTTLSGTFLTKVFEGPYKNMRSWIDEMKAYVAAEGKTLKKLYFFYTTCPKCSKKYGKNYVVLLAQV